MTGALSTPKEAGPRDPFGVRWAIMTRAVELNVKTRSRGACGFAPGKADCSLTYSDEKLASIGRDRTSANFSHVAPRQAVASCASAIWRPRADSATFCSRSVSAGSSRELRTETAVAKSAALSSGSMIEGDSRGATAALSGRVAAASWLSGGSARGAAGEHPAQANPSEERMMGQGFLRCRSMGATSPLRQR